MTPKLRCTVVDEDAGQTDCSFALQHRDDNASLYCLFTTV